MTMTEWQIRMSQAGIEPEEPIVEPWPAWMLGTFWAMAIFGCLISLGATIYGLWQAYQALA